MKKILQLLIAIVFTSVARAQNEPITKHAVYISPTLGVGATFSDFGDKTKTPPVGIGVDFGVTENITAGGYVGYASTGGSNFGIDYKYSHILIGARGAYHFEVSPKFKPYAGVMLGFHNVKYSDNDPDYDISVKTSAILYSGFAGARLDFSNSASAFAELGYGIAYLNLGITFKVGK